MWGGVGMKSVLITHVVAAGPSALVEEKGAPGRGFWGLHLGSHLLSHRYPLPPSLLRPLWPCLLQLHSEHLSPWEPRVPPANWQGAPRSQAPLHFLLGGDLQQEVGEMTS